MKRMISATYLCLFAVLSIARATTVTFDSPTDLSTEFRVNGQSNNLSSVSTGGITGGAVQVASSSTTSDLAVFTTGVASGMGATDTVSVYWQYESALQDPFNDRETLNLGFSASITAADLTVGVLLQSINSNQQVGLFIYSLPNVSGSTQIGQGVVLNSGDWYLTTLAVQNVGGTFSQYTVSSSTSDVGAAGTGSPAKVSALSGSHNFGLPGLESSSLLYGSFSAVGEGGNHLLDNFSVASAVPEPSGIVLLVLGVITLARPGFRRRKSSCRSPIPNPSLAARV